MINFHRDTIPGSETTFVQFFLSLISLFSFPSAEEYIIFYTRARVINTALYREARLSWKSRWHPRGNCPPRKGSLAPCFAASPIFRLPAFLSVASPEAKPLPHPLSPSLSLSFRRILRYFPLPANWTITVAACTSAPCLRENRVFSLLLHPPPSTPFLSFSTGPSTRVLLAGSKWRAVVKTTNSVGKLLVTKTFSPFSLSFLAESFVILMANRSSFRWRNGNAGQ